MRRKQKVILNVIVVVKKMDIYLPLNALNLYIYKMNNDDHIVGY